MVIRKKYLIHLSVNVMITNIFIFFLYWGGCKKDYVVYNNYIKTQYVFNVIYLNTL